MRLGSYKLTIDWGQIAFATAIVGWIAWYYFDALAASPNIQNMLLIRPATTAAVILYAVIVYKALGITRSADVREPGRTKSGRKFDYRAPAIAALMCLYVIALESLGFDVATFVFVASSMWIAGERRPWLLIGFSAVFAVALALCFRIALYVPVPTLVI